LKKPVDKDLLLVGDRANEIRAIKAG
jgi:hypothetical protein